jgi:hypothetical protein
MCATGVWRFTFGTPTSVTRRGFTKVTVEDALSPSKDFGFESAQGAGRLCPGGSETARPNDEYNAHTYGAYRTASDLTCAFVEGTADNAFVVALSEAAQDALGRLPETGMGFQIVDAVVWGERKTLIILGNGVALDPSAAGVEFSDDPNLALG